MAFEVFLYCDTCGHDHLKDDAGVDRSARVAVGFCLANAKRWGFRRTRHGWQCPDCIREKVTAHVDRDPYTRKILEKTT